jgi:hypothetical protein
VMQILSYSDIINTETFCYGDVLLRRRFVPETSLLTGDVFLQRRSVTETFCMETFLSRRRFVRRLLVCAAYF